jgi:hypothetical protein
MVPYTTRELITDAYYISGIVSRNFQTPTEDQISDGLNRFNGFLQIKGAQTELIPYYSVVEGQFVPDQEIYFIPNLLEIDTFAFFLSDPNNPSNNTVRFQMEPYSRYQYFQTPRAENIESLPYTWHLERTLGGANVYVYFIPNQAYNYQLTGKFALATTDLNQDLSQVYDGWYIEYLKYGLAIYLCEWRQVTPPASVVATFNGIESYTRGLGKIDMTFRKLSYFRSGGGLNWGDVNYGHWWRSP